MGIKGKVAPVDTGIKIPAGARDVYDFLESAAGVLGAI